MVTLCPACSHRIESQNQHSPVRCPRCGTQIRSQTHPDQHPDRSPPPSDSHPVTSDDTFVPLVIQNEASAIEPTMLQPASERLGQVRRVAHFRLIRVLGRGGFGEVWLAEDERLERRVALKLPTDADKHPRFLHEAQTGARLRHPHIVTVYDVGEVDSQTFIASEYIEGETLKDELQRGRPTVERTVHVMELVARAAHHAHEQGVVHRDLKPANVMISKDGEPHVADFGIAKSIAADATISLDGEIIGTIAYMAPEQAQGRNRQTDRRADVYAMGVMLFELLTEYRPFRGNAEGILVQKGQQDAPSPRELVPTVSSDLETVCLKCLERDPDGRYQTALEFAEELERIRLNIPIHARPVSRVEKAWRWCRRNALVSGLATMVIASLIAGMTGVSFFAVAAKRSADDTEAALYRARMSLASDISMSGDIERLMELLAIYADAPNGREDLRDFAWHHFQHRTAPFQQVVQHGSRVDDVAISSDGSVFASMGPGDEVRVWDSGDGSLIRSYPADDAWRFTDMTFFEKDLRLITACDDGAIRIWHPTEHGRMAFQLDGSPSVTAISRSPNGTHLAAGDSVGNVTIWHLGQRKKIQRIDGTTTGPVAVLAWSSASSQLAILTTESTTGAGLDMRHLTVVNMEDKESVYQSQRPQPYSDATFSGDGKRLLLSAKNGVYFSLDPTSGRLLPGLRQRTAFGDLQVVRHGEKDRIFMTTVSGQTWLLDDDLQPSNIINTHRQSFGSLDASRAAGRLVIGSGDGTARLLTVQTVLPPTINWRSSVVRSVQFIDNGKGVAIAESDGSVSRWNLESNTVSEVLPVQDRPRPTLGLAVHPVSGMLAACGMMRELRLADPSSEGVVKEVRLPPSGHNALAWSADGTYLATASRSGTVTFYDENHLEQPLFDHTRADVEIRDVTFSPLHPIAVVAFNDGTLLAIDVPRKTISERFEAVQDRPVCLAFAPDGLTLAVGTQAGKIQMYDPASGQVRKELKAHAGRVNSIAWFPAGDLIVSAGQDTDIQIRETDTYDIVTILRGHEHQVFRVAVAPDGTSVVSCGSDGDVRLWRTAE